MIWYVLALIGATVLFGGGVYTAFHFRTDKLDDFIDCTNPENQENEDCQEDD